MKSRPNEPPMPDPLGFFLTWSTYGTWLPGDERGWIWHDHGEQRPDPIRKLEAEAVMTEDACRLDQDERRIVEATIKQHCAIRGWNLHFVNCRSNHLHVVVSANEHPDMIRKQLKAWCSRKLKGHQQNRFRSDGLSRPVREKWWAERGSGRYLTSEASLEAAIIYVRDCQ